MVLPVVVVVEFEFEDGPFIDIVKDKGDGLV